MGSGRGANLNRRKPDKESPLNLQPAGAASAGKRPTFRALTLRGAWRLAGVLFIVASLSTIPATFLLDTRLEPWEYSISGTGVVVGLICLVVPWWRVSERWLAVLPVLAIGLIAAMVAVSDFVFTYLYFVVALWIALVFPHPGQMAPYLLLIGAGLVAPLAYDDQLPRETLLWALAVAPGIVLTAVVVARLTAGLEESRAAYRQLSTEDGLTGVGNYRSLIERLRHETARHHRRGREFALLTLDLDNFKHVNESQGHLVGDLVLAIVGSMIDLKVRTEDAVFRQGGDEFSVIAPETDRYQAELLGRRIEEAINRVSSGEVRLSASVGVAVFPHDGYEPGELLDSADAALLWRKRQLAQEGNGRTRTAPHPPGTNGTYAMTPHGVQPPQPVAPPVAQA